MKKVFKWIGILILITILGWVAVIAAAKYVFTKRINLLCDGHQIITVDRQGKTSVEKIHKLESLIIKITTYPYSDTSFFISTTDDSFSPNDVGTISQIDDLTISANTLFQNEHTSVDKSVSFNRFTRIVEIERKIEYKKENKKEEKVFEGVCKEVVPL